jgi:amino acid transporter
LTDKSLFHRLSLVPLLAWIGLGADGLSSSSYGPEEAFRTLGEHTYLALALGLATALTVLIISTAYSRIIAEFPHGGGGYLVATKLLGPRVGVVSGSALLVDYVLTIAVSIASACDAIFSFLPLEWQPFKLPAAALVIVGLTTLNIRGVKESVLLLSPIFVVFLVTHVILIAGGFFVSLGNVPQVAHHVSTGFRQGLGTLGYVGMFLLFAHAYSMGAGTYTGLEAVSNGLPIMRAPQVQTARRTMVYMAASLSFTAGGLIVCYLLRQVQVQSGRTLNAVLLNSLSGDLFIGGAVFTVVTLIAEGMLLVVGAQTGFLDGPRVLADMAVDNWVPRRFASLSERLTSQNGYMVMGAASLAVLLYARGDVRRLVIMYSINVFITFSLSMFGMLRMWATSRRRDDWKRHTALFAVGFVLCATILTVTVYMKFAEGGWLTLLVTGACVGLAFLIKRHYGTVGEKLAQLDKILGGIPTTGQPNMSTPDSGQATAAVMVGAYGGLGIHTILNIFKSFPGYFKNLVFVSVGIVDSGAFKGEGEVENLRVRTEEQAQKYVALARRLGFASTFRIAMGTDPVDEAEKLCVALTTEFPRVVFFAGKVIFQKEHWYSPLLHNQMAYSVQKRLQWRGVPMVILPVRVT